VPRRELPDHYRHRVEAIKTESPVMKINLAVSEPPRFTMLSAERLREGNSGGFFIAPTPTIDYKGPIRGLYRCGSGAWPGGCVMGAPGHNAAPEVIAQVRAGRY
jgi:hypothetical protein